MSIKKKIVTLSLKAMEKLLFIRKSYSPRTTVAKLISTEPCKVLDLCCGLCSQSIPIAMDNTQAIITGVDYSEEMIEIARRKLKKLSISNLELLNMDVMDLEVQEGFDTIIISLVIHELGWKRSKVLLEKAKELLNDGGSIIIVEWAEPDQVMQSIMFKFVKLFEHKSFEQFLKRDLIHYFESLNLSIKGVHYCDYTQVYEVM